MEQANEWFRRSMVDCALDAWLMSPRLRTGVQVVAILLPAFAAYFPLPGLAQVAHPHATFLLAVLAISLVAFGVGYLTMEEGIAHVFPRADLRCRLRHEIRRDPSLARLAEEIERMSDAQVERVFSSTVLAPLLVAPDARVRELAARRLVPALATASTGRRRPAERETGAPSDVRVVGRKKRHHVPS